MKPICFNRVQPAMCTDAHTIRSTARQRLSTEVCQLLLLDVLPLLLLPDVEKPDVLKPPAPALN